MTQNGPACQNNHFSENDVTKIQSSLNDHLQGVNIHVPLNTNKCPASLAKWAFKEKMPPCFLCTFFTLNTIV